MPVIDHLAFTQLNELESNEFETTWVKIQIQSKSVIACSCYLPPNTKKEKQEDFLDYLTDCLAAAQRHNPHILIVAGDVNGGNLLAGPGLTNSLTRLSI